MGVVYLGLCDTESVLRTFKIIYLTLSIIRIIIPVIIVILGTKDMMNAAISSKSEDFKINSKTLIKRVIAGLVIFLIPNMINVLFNLITGFEEKPSEFASCTVCLTNEKECDSLMAIAEENDRKKHEEVTKQMMENHKITEEDIENYKKKQAEMQARRTVKESQDTQTTTSRTVSKTGYFNSEDVRQISGLTEQQFIEVLRNSTAYKGKAKVYIPLAKDLIAAERNHGVNAFYLIGLYSYESGWLGSELTKKCNNIGGVRFYSQSYGNGKTATNCLSRYAGFDSISEFVDFHAGLLERKYLTPGASHYNGTSVAAIAKDYGSGHGIDTIIQIATRVSSQ